MQPNSAEYAYLLGLSLYSDGHSQQALQPLEQSVRLNPEAARAHMVLGSALDRSGNRLDAETQWRLALAINPRSTIARSSLSRDLLADKDYSAVIALLGPLASNETLSNTLTVDLSVAYTKSGLVYDAYKLLDAARQRNPDSVVIAEALGGVLVLQGRYEQAEKVLSSILVLHPSDLPIDILYLRTLVLAHDPRAEGLEQRLLQAHPHEWQLVYLAGVLSESDGDYGKARTDFMRSIELNPDDGESHYHLGLVSAALKNPAAALKEFDRAMALGYRAPQVYYERGRVLHALGETQEAQQQFLLYQKSLKARSAFTRAVSEANRGDAVEAKGEFNEAVAAYRAAVQADPTQPIFQYKLAMAYAKTGNRAQERKVLNRTVQLSPHMAVAQNQLGYLDFSEGNTEPAIRRFKRAVKANPGYVKAWMNLSAALCLQARLSEADDALHHVLALDPDNRSAKELLQRIREAQAKP